MMYIKNVVALMGLGLLIPRISFAVNYSDFSSTSGLNLVGSAAQAGSALRLTPATPYQAGAAWTDTKQEVQAGFETSFDFKITPEGDQGADGLAFVIQNDNASALGKNGGAIGFVGIQNTLAILFDTYLSNELFDFHVKVMTHVDSSEDNALAAEALAYSKVGNIRDGGSHRVNIDYVPGRLKVFVDNPLTPVLTVPFDLGTINLDSGKAWVGFTGATGQSFENHDILNWNYSASAASALPDSGSTLILLSLTVSVFVLLKRPILRDQKVFGRRLA